MQRFFLELGYLGTHYHGWQKQLNANSIQELLESNLSKIVQTETPLTGCGRTDTGVHASQYYAHFDCSELVEKEQFVYKLNRMLPPDIAIYRCLLVHHTAHARYDAMSRKYRFQIIYRKNPFQKDTAYLFPFSHQCNWDIVEESSRLLMEYDSFFPFCKSHSGVENYKVKIFDVSWLFHEYGATFTITGNRFLRGMVRLIVGACLNAGLSKLSISEIRKALENQVLLERSWSVPPQGLFLESIRYPYIEVG